MTNKPTPSQTGSNLGKLIPLKTTLETNPTIKLLEVWITAVQAKNAASTLTAVRRMIPKDGGFDFSHLRRFARLGLLPPRVREVVSGGGEGDGDGDVIFLIVGATSLILEDTVRENLGDGVVLVRGFVPVFAPTTEEQAREFSGMWWPCVYKRSNPFGPHSSLVERVQVVVEGGVERWMGLAWRVAREARVRGVGEGVGVVVVERVGSEERCVAVAGDARWVGWERGGGGGGNVIAHACLRVIGMVTSRLSSALRPTMGGSDVFRTGCLLECENEGIDDGSGDGYLCHELEIYCTHEPCVMCSMAIVHSRFGKVVFEKRMQATGGMCADGGGLGHGLWWRKELNWTCLGWEFKREKRRGEMIGKEEEWMREVDGRLNA